MNRITQAIESIADNLGHGIVEFDKKVMPYSNSELMSSPDYAARYDSALAAVKKEWFGPGVPTPDWIAYALVPFAVAGDAGEYLAKNPVVRTAMFALAVASCAAPGMTPEVSDFIDSDGDGIPDSLEGVIPVGTVTPESATGATSDVYVYHSEALGITANHGFDPSGNLLTVGLLRGTEIASVSDLDGTTHVTLAGDLMGEPGSYVTYDENGRLGYAVSENVATTDLSEWVSKMNLDEAKTSEVKAFMDQVESSGADAVTVTMETARHLDEATGTLESMDVRVVFQSGEGIVAIDGDLQEISKADIFAGTKIASIDSNLSSAINGADINLDIVPSDWVDSGDGHFVSPEFVSLQTSIDNTGDRFNLTPDGSLTDKDVVIPGIHVDPNGKITVEVDGAPTEIGAADMSLDDKNGATIKGYSFDEEKQVWTVELFDVDFVPGFEYKHEVKIDIVLPSGNKIDFTLATGEELNTISKFELNDGWVSTYGLTPEQGFATFGLRSCYRAWVENGGNKGTFIDYAELHRIAQESGKIEDWMKVAITTDLNDLTTEKYDAKPKIVLPFYIDRGAELPEGVDYFTRMEIAMTKVKTSNTDSLLLVDSYRSTSGTFGWGSSLAPNKVLYGHVAVGDTKPRDTNSSTRIPLYALSYWQKFFVRGNPNLMGDNHLFDSEAVIDLGIRDRREFYAAFQTYSADGKLTRAELQYNP